MYVIGVLALLTFLLLADTIERYRREKARAKTSLVAFCVIATLLALGRVARHQRSSFPVATRPMLFGSVLHWRLSKVPVKFKL